MDLKFELLKAEKEDKRFKIVGTIYSDEITSEFDFILRASMLTIERVKLLLAEGKNVYLPELSKYVEYQVNELIIDDNLTELDMLKNAYITELNTKLRNILISIKFLDMFKYLNATMSLLNHGIYITDQNRNDVYIDIFNKYVSIEEPEPVADDATFDEVQSYIKKKDEYLNAKSILTNLETYMNEYENILQISTIYDVIMDAIKNVTDCENIDDFNNIVKESNERIANFNVLN